MSGSGVERMGLVEFLADLRSDLVAARKTAIADARQKLDVEGSALLFDVGEVSVTLEVAHTSTVGGKASTEVEGKFWVFASAKAGAEVSGESSHAGTQTLTLTLTPQLQTKVKDPTNGLTKIVTSGIKISGEEVPNER